MLRQMKQMRTEIIKTLDGSHTLYLPDIDEHYHSTFGAVQESNHVFVDAGYRQCEAASLTVVEIGFGTGLNCFLTLKASKESGQQVRYLSLDKYAVPEESWSKLNYGLLSGGGGQGDFEMLHKAPWNVETAIQPHFSLLKIKTDLLEWRPEGLQADLVYFDAFSPDRQPEMWGRNVFELMHSLMKEDALLVTYCAKGAIRRLLQAVGFQVERMEGPPGKREMIRAIKKIV